MDQHFFRELLMLRQNGIPRDLLDLREKPRLEQVQKRHLSGPTAANMRISPFSCALLDMNSRPNKPQFSLRDRKVIRGL